MSFRNSKTDSLPRIEAVSRARWERTFFLYPPHLSFGFQMGCSLTLLEIDLVFPVNCPSAHGVSSCCFYFSPAHIGNLIHSHPVCYHLSLVKITVWNSRHVFPAAPWTLPPGLSPLSQIDTSKTKRSFLPPKPVLSAAFHLCEW